MIKSYYPLITVNKFCKQNKCNVEEFRKAISDGIIQTSFIDGKEYLEINSTTKYINDIFEKVLLDNSYKKKYEFVLNNALHLNIEHKILTTALELEKSNTKDNSINRVLSVAKRIKERREKDHYLKSYFMNVSEPDKQDYCELKSDYRSPGIKVGTFLSHIQENGLYHFTQFIFIYKPNPPFIDNSIDILSEQEQTDIKKQIKKLIVCEKAHTFNI